MAHVGQELGLGAFCDFRALAGFFGGMASTSSSWFMVWKNRLEPGCPGFTTAPLLPPAIRPACR